MPKPDYWLHYLEWVSMIHGLTCVLLGGYCIYKDGEHFNARTTYWEYVCISNSCAYFIYDSIVEWYFETLDPGITAHHIASVSLTVACLMDEYGGTAMMSGLFFAELSNQFFILRAAWKRKGQEDTLTFQIFLWAYALLYIYSRGYRYTYNTYYIVFSLNIPFYLKCVFLPNLFLSHAWLILVVRMLWNSWPNWFSDPKTVSETEWWKKGRRAFTKYTKDSPWVYISSGIVALYSAIIPIIVAYYAHFVDNSIGFKGAYV